MKGCKSPADRLGIPVGVSGETVKGVLITESNRVSDVIPETDAIGLQNLKQRAHFEYRRYGVPATAFGLNQPNDTAQYALYAKVS
jgi:hypothetical protein